MNKIIIAQLRCSVDEILLTIALDFHCYFAIIKVINL